MVGARPEFPVGVCLDLHRPPRPRAARQDVTHPETVLVEPAVRLLEMNVVVDVDTRLAVAAEISPEPRTCCTSYPSMTRLRVLAVRGAFQLSVTRRSPESFVLVRPPARSRAAPPTRRRCRFWVAEDCVTAGTAYQAAGRQPGEAVAGGDVQLPQPRHGRPVRVGDVSRTGRCWKSRSYGAAEGRGVAVNLPSTRSGWIR